MPRLRSAAPQRTGHGASWRRHRRSARAVARGDRLFREEQVGERLVKIGQALDQARRRARRFSGLAARGSGRSTRRGRGLAVEGEVRRFHEIDETWRTSPRAARASEIGNRLAPQAFLDPETAASKSRADAVHLVDERDTRHAGNGRPGASTVSDCGSTPSTPSNTDDRAVEHAQRALDLRGEIHVPAGVDRG
jgi:hypothetical protein